MFKYRNLITQPDLNAHGTLHGGILVKWVDEACGMEARIISKLVCATRFINKINFLNKAKLGDIIEISVINTNIGNTSLTFSAEVHNLNTKKLVANIQDIVFVAVDKNHKPVSIDL